MIRNILNAWKDYATYMGSQVQDLKNGFLAINNMSLISCDFSNCIVSMDNIDSGFANSFNIRPIQSYRILLKEQLRTQSVAAAKIASLMVLQYENFIKLAKATDSPELKVKVLAFNELSGFAEVVFDAFNYDIKNFKESLEFYKKGFKSSMVQYYGLTKEDTLVSVVLVHRSINESLYGLELVSTSKQFQGKGYSKLLLSCVMETLFYSNPEAIWLFSIEGSIAESIYKKMGFSSVGKILISKLE